MASFVLFLSILGLLTPLSFADENNILLTNDVLGTDDQLNYEGNVFVMQGDCNLVLYATGSPGFQSNTHGRGTNCTLTLDNRGKLIIMSGGGSTVWTSTLNTETEEGNYAAVLGPDGEVNVFGPNVFSIPPSSSAHRYDSGLRNVPMVRNVLFSSQVLYGNSRLTTRDYQLRLDDCNLALIKASQIHPLWQSGTQGNGLHCFLRLDHSGRLAIIDDLYTTIWASGNASREGDYVLILQINGQAVVYGPVVWSTSSGRIQSVTSA